MAHTITPANIFGDFCTCVEKGLDRLLDSLLERAASATRNQLPKSRQLLTYPTFRLPEAELDDVFEELVKIEEGVLASVINKIPRPAQAPAGEFLQCLQDQINKLICDFLDEADPFGLIKGYGDLFSETDLSIPNLNLDFNLQLDIYASICGEDPTGFQSIRDNAFFDANLTTSGSFDICASTTGILTGSYKEKFDNSVLCVNNMYIIRNTIEDFVLF